MKEIRPGRRFQASNKAIHDEDHRHGDHDLVDAKSATRGLVNDFGGTLQHIGRVDGEIAKGEDGVDAAHPGAIAVFHHLGQRGPPHATKHRCHDPVEWSGKQVLPLIPDSGSPYAVDGASQRHRHLRMRTDAEALAHHQPLSETAFAEKVMIGILHTEADNNPNAGAEQQIADQKNPVEGCNVHGLECTSVGGMKLPRASESSVVYSSHAQPKKRDRELPRSLRVTSANTRLRNLAGLPTGTPAHQHLHDQCL